MEYEKLLERAMRMVPKEVKEASRFETPTAKILPAGARTIIINFVDMANTFHRDPQHLLKFILKELATKGEIDGKRLIVMGKFSQETVNKKIELYAKTYVLCYECGKPDTKLVKEGKFVIMKCEACGARHTVPKI